MTRSIRATRLEPQSPARERDELADLAAVIHAAQALERLCLGAQHEPSEVLSGVELGPLAHEVDGRHMQIALEQVGDQLGQRSGWREHT